jgi:hypothetical protein
MWKNVAQLLVIHSSFKIKLNVTFIQKLFIFSFLAFSRFSFSCIVSIPKETSEEEQILKKSFKEKNMLKKIAPKFKSIRRSLMISLLDCEIVITLIE